MKIIQQRTAASGVVAAESGQTVFPILLALSFSHLLNDTMQSLIPSIYPMVKDSFQLSFSQIGLITFTFQVSASILQPLVGLYTDKRPQPYALAIGMCFTLLGLVSLSLADSFHIVLLSVGLIGIGSAVFHPEASRVAHMASGGRHGMAQSLFQVGGNAGSSLGPLLAAMILLPYGRFQIIWFSLVALLAIFILSVVGNWYKANMDRSTKKSADVTHQAVKLPTRTVVFSVGILLLLIFSKYIYMASISSYFTFYLIHKFGVSIQNSQIYLFAFLFSVAAGTFIGGPVGDRIGRKYVIWISILGVAPFALALPYVNLFWTGVLSCVIGLILSSAFSAILVYAQELIPGKVGMIAGLFFGFAFGIGGIGSALLGNLADKTSIEYVFNVCSFLPLIGLITGFLPNLEKKKTA
ncbi:MFS transporter [Dyadobacter bucti]|uniref:MFS transporter n=1 Tax=Dyadobacter bucti TaxID=2572203 RepID=UPI001107CD0E|nr:MFS transporter [Dyadobacter bucti]